MIEQKLNLCIDNSDKCSFNGNSINAERAAVSIDKGLLMNQIAAISNSNISSSTVDSRACNKPEKKVRRVAYL